LDHPGTAKLLFAVKGDNGLDVFIVRNTLICQLLEARIPKERCMVGGALIGAGLACDLIEAHHLLLNRRRGVFTDGSLPLLVRSSGNWPTEHTQKWQRSNA
jgi:hypothetical protein